MELKNKIEIFASIKFDKPVKTSKTPNWPPWPRKKPGVIINRGLSLWREEASVFLDKIKKI
jgi:hypothetical protein